MKSEGKGKKGKFSKQQMDSAAYNAVTRLYNERTLERLKDLASGKLDVESVEKEIVEITEKSEKPKTRKKKVASPKKDEESAPTQE